MFSNQQTKSYMKQNDSGNTTSESQICRRHKTYRDNADKSDWSKICKIAGIVKL